MGICISCSASARKIQDGNENAMFFGKNIDLSGVQSFGSLYSKAGSKGLNQDSAILYQGYGVGDASLCGVFDGHGKNGHIVSEMVKNHLPALLQSQMQALEQFTLVTKSDGEKNYDDKTDTESKPSKNFKKWEDALCNAFRVMDKEIKLQQDLDCSCSGTTAVIALRQGKDLYIANLGDSRAILGTMTENGIKGIQLTTDLKPGVPSESERIRACNGRVFALEQEKHIQRVWLPHELLPGLAMSRAFGDFVLKDHGIIAVPDVSHRCLTSEDQFIVLATDGVWDVLTNNEVASIVWEAKTAEEAARTVTETAIATWKTKYPASKIDDCTVVCLFFSSL
ncbi:probable protein phosphatase 2C 72 [Argentina anserina]|uniref:probable protein phosphatase 2C 72 n=1 Tax=Argentina anserina TaxID=57926 RepID=UPI0021767445|nr:probable protein phosphatase 2C 72 [Potentilla anserina]